MEDGLFSQVCFTGLVTDCAQWTANKWKPNKCSCGYHFLDHMRSASTEEDIVSYLSYLDSMHPCNEILCANVSLNRGALFLGSKGACVNSIVERNSITCIVQAANNLESFFPSFGKQINSLKERGVFVLQLGWIDSMDFRLENLHDAILFLHSHISRQQNCLVNCAQGKSRSASLVIAYLLSIDHDMTFEYALEFVKQKRSIAEPNSNFCMQLRQYALGPRIHLS